jgi:thiosulfate/3-mercaptopyruvate sulfurtransferase
MVFSVKFKQGKPMVKRIIFVFLFLFSLQAMAAPVYVSTDWLAGKQADKNVVVVDMSASDLQYTRFHIPGAIRLPYRALVRYNKVKKYSVRISNKELVILLGKLGINHNKHVVIYDDMGGLEAAKLFWHLEQIGHPAVSVVDGGLVQWILQGRKVTNKPTKRLPVVYKASGKGLNNEATLADVLKASHKKSSSLLDVRTIEEYVGNVRKGRGGHVPGALLWQWDKSLDIANGFTRRKPQQLLAGLRKLGIDGKNKPIIAYCRSGHRAAQSYLVLRSLGFNKVRLYSNSMNEYGSIRTAPLQQGTKP